MSIRLSLAELREVVRMTDHLARGTLEHWRRTGIAEERHGQWRMTRSGQATFGGWASGIELDDRDVAA